MTGVSIQDRRVRGAILAGGVVAGVVLSSLNRHVTSPVLLVSIVLNMVGSLSRRRPAFTADGRSFTTTQIALAYIGVVAMLTASIAMLGDARRDDLLRTVFVPLWALVVAFLGAHSVLYCWQPPGITLTPDGIVRRSAFRTRTTRWDELTGPVAFTRSGAFLILTVNGRREWIFPALIRTDHRFAGDAMEYYRTHPEHRPAIGTADEHARLDSALRDRYAAYLRWRLAAYGR